MRKLLSILAILVVAIAVKAEDIKINKTSFMMGMQTADTVSIPLDLNVSLNAKTATPGIVSTLNDMTISYDDYCMLTIAANADYGMKSVELIFSDEVNSPANVDNGCDIGTTDAKTTSGLVISGNKVTYTGITSSINVCCKATDGQKHTMVLKGVNITYVFYPYNTWTRVSTAKEFADAVSNNSNIVLTQDINLSSLSTTKDKYLFNSFSGKITGANPSGQDFSLIGGTHPLFYRLSGATLCYLKLSDFRVSDATSVVARTSGNTTFNHVKIVTSKLTPNDSGSNAGMMSGWSDSDTFEYCTVALGCSITVKKENVGGVCGFVNTNSTFDYCINGATITSSSDGVGGIVGSIGKSGHNAHGSIRHCLNRGDITCGKWTGLAGGIAGYSYDNNVEYCVNAGTITNPTSGSLSGNYGSVAGIIAFRWGDSQLAHCINLGNLSTKAKMPAYQIANDDNNYVSDLYYHGTANGTLESNLSAMGTSYEDMLSGKFAYEKKNWYQDIDNNVFDYRMPVPFPEAGIVYTNILCDGTLSYSNKYQSSAAHDLIIARNSYSPNHSICAVCGHLPSTSFKGNIIINDVNAFVAFTNLFRNDKITYPNATTYLQDDMDLKGAGFAPIGDANLPYCGTFDGQGHRIKNYSYLSQNGYSGLFRCVGVSLDSQNAGIVNVVIKNLIVDSSCSFESDEGTGTAGLVGVVQAPSGCKCNVYIHNCGNEAPVYGWNVSGGLVGTVGDNDDTYLEIANSYNTGDIDGNSCSAALCGYAHKNFTIKNCYNSGSVKGVEGTNYFYRCASEGIHTVADCYGVNGSQEGVTQINPGQLRLGDVCFLLNNNHGPYRAWTQCIGKDNFPTFGDDGVHYTRTMTNEWGTICLPYAIQADDDVFELYKITNAREDALSLQKVDELPAGCPAVIRSHTLTPFDIPAVGTTFAATPAEGSSVNGLTLTGTYDRIEITKQTGYIIAKNAFWNLSEIGTYNGITCPAFHAYLAGALSSGAKVLNLGFGFETATDIDAIDSTLDESEKVIYDINGNKLDGLQKGINIVKFSNGVTKKILVK